MSQAPAPVIVLDRPQLGENIGQVARAMANFGLAELRLVAPRDGWPNARAVANAAFAEPIVEAARVFADLEAAIADLDMLVATTARIRDLAKPLATPETAAALLSARPPGGRAGILFGCERAGLDNDAIALADLVVMIPVAPEHASLNLAQAVLLVGYAWRKAVAPDAIGRTTPLETPAREGLAAPSPPASKAELLGLMRHLEGELDRAEFFATAAKRPHVVRHLRALLVRAAPTAQEVRTLRGVIVSLVRGPRPL